MKLLSLLFIIGIFVMVGFCRVGHAQVVPALDEAQYNEIKKAVDGVKIKLATFAGGCFWCTESFFIEDEGVLAVQVGYTGGHVVNPTYQQVSGEKTGHAEALEVVYNSEIISYDQLLDLFFESHDPTQLNRQGPDIGPQYRGAVFYHDEGQKQEAQARIDALNASGKYDAPLVTELNPAGVFYRAEEYHQRYYWDKGVDKDRLKEMKGY